MTESTVKLKKKKIQHEVLHKGKDYRKKISLILPLSPFENQQQRDYKRWQIIMIIKILLQINVPYTFSKL